LRASQRQLTLETAPRDAKYVTLAANATLTDEFSLATLTTGHLSVGVSGSLANLSSSATIPATDLSGTIPDARFPATLPAVSGANLTALSASALASGTVPSARLGSPLPALDASALTALTGTNVVHQVRTITFASSPYTVVAADEVLLVDATGGAVTVTLPTATSGRLLAVKKVDSSGNAVTLTGTVDGVVNPTLAGQWNARWVVGNGTNWNVLGTV